MTAPSGTRGGGGTRNFQLFELDDNGYPAATSATTAYAGLDVSGIKRVSINAPEARILTFIGDDKPIAVMELPALEPLVGEVITSEVNDTVEATFGQSNSFTVGEAKMFGINTDQSGKEHQVGVLVYQQAVEMDEDNANFGKTVWHWKLMPKGWLLPRQESMDENPTEKAYSLRPAYVTKHLWGTAFTTTTEGFVKAQLLQGVTEYEPKILAWEGDDSTTEFNLSPSVAKDTTAKIECWMDGVLQSAGITVTTNQVTFTTAPTTGAMVVVLYEIE